MATGNNVNTVGFLNQLLPSIQGPLDARFCFDTLANRDLLSDQARHEGLITYVEETELVYILEGGITNGHWITLNGHNFLSGSGVPANTLGSNMDTYLDADNGDVYRKRNDIWEATGQNLRGPQGADGAMGADGQAATIAIGTTTTGDAGTDAIVTNSGTSSAAIFDFTLPRGAVGPQGPAGRDGSDAGTLVIENDSAPLTGTFTQLNFDKGLTASVDGTDNTKVNVNLDTSSLVDDDDITVTDGEVTNIRVGTTNYPIGGGIDLQVFENGETMPQAVADGSYIIGGGGIGITYGRLEFPADSGTFYDNVINFQFDPDEIALGAIAQNRINGLTGQIMMLETADSTNATAISNETTRAEAVERHLSDNIANQTLGPILRRSGVPAEIFAPTGNELITSIDESDFIRLAYFIHDPQGHSTLSLELIPDSATLANGMWTLMDGGVTVATLPNNSSFLIGRYDNASPTSTDTPSFTGHPKFVRWNTATGVFFYDLEIVTGDAYLVSNSGALEDGQMDIDGQTQLGNVFRNWRTIALVPNEGALEGFIDGVNQGYRFREFAGNGNIVTIESVPSTLSTGGAVVNVPQNVAANTVLDITVPAADFTGLRQQYVEGQIATLYQRSGNPAEEFSVYLRFDEALSEPDRLRFVVDSTDGNFNVTGGVDGPWALFPGWEGTGSGTTAGVSRIIAGTNITVDPEAGTGNVTINSTATGSGVEMVAYTDLPLRAASITEVPVTFNLAVTRYNTTGSNTEFELEARGATLGTFTIPNDSNNFTFDVEQADLDLWGDIELNDVRLNSTLMGSTLSHIPVGRLNTVTDDDTTLAIQASGSPETGVSTVNFRNRLAVDNSSGVASVDVVLEPHNLRAGLPDNTVDIAGGLMYPIRYEIGDAVLSAPTVTLFGQTADTVPATLPSTPGVHDALVSFSSSVVVGFGNESTYGTSVDNLLLNVNGARYHFSGGLIDQGPINDSVQARLQSLDDRTSNIEHQVTANVFRTISYPWYEFENNILTSGFISFGNAQTFNFTRGNRLDQAPNQGASASFEENFGPYLRASASAGTRYATTTLSNFNGTTDSAVYTIGWKLSDGETDGTTGRWELMYTPPFTTSLPACNRIHVRPTSSRSTFLGWREIVTARANQIPYVDTTTRVQDVIDHFTDHTALQLAYQLDGNASITEGRITQVVSSGGSPFTTAISGYGQVWLDVGLTSPPDLEEEGNVNVYTVAGSAIIDTPVFRTLTEPTTDLSGLGIQVQVALRFGGTNTDPIEVYVTEDAGANWTSHTVASTAMASQFGDLTATDRNSEGADTTISSSTHDIYFQSQGTHDAHVGTLGTGNLIIDSVSTINNLQFTRMQYTSVIVGGFPVRVTTGIPAGFRSALQYTDGTTNYFRLFRSDGTGEELRIGTITGTTVYNKTR